MLRAALLLCVSIGCSPGATVPVPSTTGTGAGLGTESGTITATATRAETGTITATATASATATGTETEAGSAAPLPDAALLVTDPAVLAELERRGLSLVAALGATGPSDTASLLQRSSLFRDFQKLVSLDDSVAKWRDPRAATGFRATHRLFDIAWLSSTRTHFELVGVVNRADRRHASAGACGELRLVYRLAYRATRVRSRLPMTLNLVFAQAPDCRSVAHGWLALERVPRVQLAAALLAGPLATRGAPIRLETNFQSGRWPSAVRPRLGGHAEYVLRVFDVEDGRAVLSTLENTPTQKLDHTRRRELRRWLAQRTDAIEAGTLLLPERFLAERSVSVQPRGIARLANRPFSQIAPLPDAALTRRLDQLSCKGCHASRSLAGFHLLGEDGPDTPALNAIAVGASPHLLGELPWRRGFLQALAHGQEPAAARPIADRGSGRGLLGEACGTGSEPAFAAWGCATGLVCKDRHGTGVGSCARAGGNGLGDGVELGRLNQTRDALRDGVRSTRVEECLPLDDQAVRVARSSNGFPAGMCHAPCERLGDERGDAICGPVPFGKGTTFDGFTKCLAVHEEPFDRCLADDMHPTWLARCDRRTPCRDDYLCVRSGGDGGDRDDVGACLPPYFLFQVRVDGHHVER